MTRLTSCAILSKAMKIEAFLKNDKVIRLPIRYGLMVGKETPVSEVMVLMKEKKVSCTLIVEEGKPVGIFTERDVLKKIAASKTDLHLPVVKFMSSNPKVLKAHQSVGSAIKTMVEGRYRNVPLVDSKGRALGYLAVKDIVRYLASFFPYEVYNLPPEPNQVQQSPEGA